MQCDVKDNFACTLREGATRWTRFCLCCVKPYSSVQKQALLSLKGTDMWRKVLTQGDLWGGINLSRLTEVEYCVPMKSVVAALGEARTILREDYSHVMSVVKIRFIKGSNALLACHNAFSPHDVFGFLNVQLRTKSPDPDILDKIQTKMMAFGGRPHWGSYNTTTRSTIDKNMLWPKENLEAFIEVKKTFDPKNILGNSHLDEVLWTSKSEIEISSTCCD
jgi:FAD/FMN-containing dehydrogenase